MKEICQLETEVRDLINQPRKRYLLIKDTAQWNKLCSSLDVIGDTELAIKSYLLSQDKPTDTGELYIILYGILQILFVQQDALDNLNEALGLFNKKIDSFRKIREIRNSSIGHPTKRRGEKGTEFNFITRMSMTRAGFTLLTSQIDGTITSSQIDLYQLLKDQRDESRKILQNVISFLKKEAMDHKNKYKDEKLVDFFHQSLNYYYEKIEQAVFGFAPKESGMDILNLVADVPKKFKDAAEKREILEAYELENYLKWVEYPILKLSQYFNNSNNNINEKDAFIYLSFIRKQIEKLRQIAEEIDEYYNLEE